MKEGLIVFPHKVYQLVEKCRIHISFSIAISELARDIALYMEISPELNSAEMEKEAIEF